MILDTEDGVHSVVLRLGPNTGNTTCKSDLAPGLVQGNIFLVLEAFCVVLRDDGSAGGVIRPPGLDIFFSCGGGNISTTDPIRIIFLDTTRAWGSSCSCRYICIKRKWVRSKVKLTCLTILLL